jgi:glycerol-3-phosphate acyltransferase PlsX
MDPRKVNGGVFLGLNGMVIKSHGGTDAEGFASAVDLAREMAKNDLVRMIAQDRNLGIAEDFTPERITAASA